jgi:hypothetical protein
MDAPQGVQKQQGTDLESLRERIFKIQIKQEKG